MEWPHFPTVKQIIKRYVLAYTDSEMTDMYTIQFYPWFIIQVKDRLLCILLFEFFAILAREMASGPQANKY